LTNNIFAGKEKVRRDLFHGSNYGIFGTMNYGPIITIDRAGRLVVPKSIREAAGLVPGMPLAIAFRDGRIEIEPAPIEVNIVERDGFTVAEPTASVETMTHESVRRTRNGIRTRRRRG
jgi:AbrB family looped-hinge helix DNA binding protein